MSCNMTDNEIVKALECCSKDEINGLNIFTYGGVPMRSLLRYILDLINRLQGENEKKDKRLKEVLKGIENIKEQAYKEFAERLKERAIQTSFDPIYGSIMTVDVDDVDNLLKELVGEDNESKN